MKLVYKLFISLLLLGKSLFAQEIIFADYFDIKTNSSAGTLVTGKLHLKSNKDVLTTAIPAGYSFELVSDASNLFEVNSIRQDIGKMQGLLIGEIRVKSGKSTPSTPINYNLTIALKNGSTTLATKTILVKVVTKTMWQYLVEHYAPATISESRLYGRTKLSDAEIANYITEINANDGQLKSVNDVFNTNPENITKLHDQWVEIANIYGAMGYAYADTKSSYYQSATIRQAIYKGARAYMNNFPVFGDDILTPMGTEIGDGYQGLWANGLHLTHGQVTHQWTTIDPLGAPLVQVAANMLADVENGDADAIALQEAIFRFYQYFFSIVPHKRVVDDPDLSWGDISDLNYSNGAWSDANIGHRMRTLMVMGIIWGDYNRPITYVPYWYDDYRDGTPNEGVDFGRGWSPGGVLNDIRHWCDLFSVSTKLYGQSGFHPDGTMSHHLPHGASDSAMRAYGYEWMDEVNVAIPYFENTPVPIQDAGYQFLADRINYTYRRLIYKGYIDYVVVGRSYYSPLEEMVTKEIKRSVYHLVNGKGPSTIIENEAELIALNDAFQDNTHKHSESVAFWNIEYLMHRSETNAKDYFFSVKQKSRRMSGAEDFESIRKTWHAGSGVFQLKVDGLEYTQAILKEYDWHMLPGVTEEWRTDAMPTGPASDAGPGLNEYSGVLVNKDGDVAMSSFYYDPTPALYDIPDSKLDQLPQYASATAYKSTHMIGNIGTALGTKIVRKDAGQGNAIYTCIDQSKHDNTLYYSINGGNVIGLSSSLSHNLVLNLTGPSWVFHDNKGYLIFPKDNNQQLHIKTGTHVNVTDTATGTSSNYILALHHGDNPDQVNLDSYHYVLVGDVTRTEMPGILATYQSNTLVFTDKGKYHAVYDTQENIVEASFFEPGTIDLTAEDWIKTDAKSMVIREETEDDITLSIADPLHDLGLTTITIEIPQILETGTYNYSFKGITQITGETAEVSHTPNGSKIVFQLPDSSDAVFYNYKEQMVAGAPVSITFPKSDAASVDDLSNEANLKIYPIPLKEETIVVVPQGNIIQQVVCYDVTGRIVFEKNITNYSNSVTVNLERLHKSNAYIIKVITDKGVLKRMVF